MENIVSEAKNEEMREVLKESKLLDSSLIQDNKLQFAVNNEKYRVRMPTQKELADAESYRYKALVRLLQEEGTITKKKLIVLLKEKQDVNIEDLENKKKIAERKLHDAYLGLALCNDDDKERLQSYVSKIESSRQEYIDLFIEIEQYLSPAIENRIEGLYAKHLTVSCTDKLNEETQEWSKVWKTYDEFEKDSSIVAVQACLNFGYIFKFNRGY
jgi:hypothetical protein